jgi:YcxB-like protein
MYRYQFTSTIEDLLEAEKAERSTSIRRSLRWVLVTFGAIWLAGGVLAFLKEPTWRPVIWICLGSLLLYRFVFQPYQRRRRIRSSNTAHQDLTLECADNSLSVVIAGVGQFTRRWDELSDITDTDGGILFYFSDGITNWLPNRVFGSLVERRNFLEFLRQHQIPGRDENISNGHTNA